MPGLLEEKVVVVTGAAQARSIGEAIARRCAEHGARVVVTSRKASDAEAAARRLRADGLDAHGGAMDLTSDDSVERFARDALDAHGRVDGIVHNAGFPVTDWARRFMDVGVEEYARVFEVDVLGAVRLTRHLVEPMAERGSGSLVFTSSTASIAGYEFLHEFGPAKAGVLGIMRSLAAEYGRRGVRSNAVAYGNVASPATWDSLTQEQRHALAQESPMRRWATPHEAAGAAVFLLSDLASFVNGQVLVADGGTVMR